MDLRQRDVQAGIELVGLDPDQLAALLDCPPDAIQWGIYLVQRSGIAAAARQAIVLADAVGNWVGQTPPPPDQAPFRGAPSVVSPEPAAGPHWWEVARRPRHTGEYAGDRDDDFGRGPTPW